MRPRDHMRQNECACSIMTQYDAHDLLITTHMIYYNS